MNPLTNRFCVAGLLATSLILAACSGVNTASSGGSGGGGGSTTPHSVSGTVSGLSGTGLVLQDNGGDSLTVTTNGTYTFVTKVTGAYAVTVLTQPTAPPQLCTVTNASGTPSSDVTNADVSCVASFTVGGTVTGVVGTGLVLQNSGGDNLTITANGAFTFAHPVATGSTYAVTVLTQPTGPAQSCTVTPGTGSGTATANVTTVAVTCKAVTFNISGTVVGLLGPPPPPPNSPLTDNSYQLQNNGGDNKIITQNGPFSFATQVAQGGAYFVTEISFPSTQPFSCTRWDFSGVVTNADISDILVDCGHDDWTFINGTKIAGTNIAQNYGVFAIPTVPPTPPPNPFTNVPGGRDSGATWIDSSKKLWLFGGFGFELSGKTPPDSQPGFLNDLWYCDLLVFGDYCDWQLAETPVMGAFPVAQDQNRVGLYGAKGTPSTLNLPGGRWGSATWNDGAGNFWFLGGQGASSNGLGLLNDLWRYNVATKAWTWVSGSNVNNQGGVYTGAPGTLTPGARWSPASWTDNSGNFWLFGGFGYDKNGQLGLLNDLWKFTGGNWVWVSASVTGSDTINHNGVYGAQGTKAATNTPGSRQTAAAWKDAAGNLWLFGGEGNDSTGTANGVLNDLWEYDIASNQWTWVTGSTAANQDGVYGPAPSIGAANISSAAGTFGINSGTASTTPGSRWGPSAWTDQSGNLWLLGGWGLDANGTHGNGYLNDLWAYTPNSTNPTQPGVWTWVKGSNTGNQNGIYYNGTRPYFTKVDWTPGARRGAMNWIDSQGEFWLFGGQGYDSTSASGDGYLNDLWRYVPFK